VTIYLDLESAEQSAKLSSGYEVVIVGGGAAGLTIARELAANRVNICVIESGSLRETPENESLNSVEASGDLEDPRVQALRSRHARQLRFWSEDAQKYGVRTRVLGGSTSAWGGRVAAFDELDFAAREWIAGSGWPISHSDLAPFLQRAAKHLNLSSLTTDRTFWRSLTREIPEPINRLKHFDSFFWQFARSRYVVTDMMRFGQDFQLENLAGVTVLLNATVASLVLADGGASGVSLVSSLGARKAEIDAPLVVLAAGAIENARLLLLSGLAEADATAPVGRPALGRFLIDHLAVSIGSFDKKSRGIASRLFGFYALQQNRRVDMYMHGLSLRPAAQQEFALPNMAVYAVPEFSEDDPLQAFKRLVRRESNHPARDIRAAVQNLGTIVTFVGRKMLEHPNIPAPVRRRIADAVVRLRPNLVAREFLASGHRRKLDDLSLMLICEQPPTPNNWIRLSEFTDRLGLPKAEIHWEIGDDLRRAILKVGTLLATDLERAGLPGFHIGPAFVTQNISELIVSDWGHTAGTTRMGMDPRTSVVDDQCQVHGVRGLYVTGASVFPTVGHANPTLVIVAMAIRLADRLRSDIRTRRRLAVADTTRATETLLYRLAP
jgi:choline dehydrogenase-like flavoprotein